MNFSEKESFSELAPHIVSCFEVLAQKIIVHDDGPTLDRLRHGDFAKTHVRLTDVDPFLEDATDRLVEYDRHISLVEEAFQKLKSARDSFKHSVEMTLSLLAPVRCLPEDVLVEIFSLYIQNCRNRRGSKERTYFLTLSEERRILSPNFTLSHVCSFWRKVVFSRPTFWSSFSLSAGALKTFEDESPIIPFLSECLSRTENAPLSLYIKLDLVDDNSDQKDAFGLFLKRAARWQHLDLFLYDHKLISPFVSWLQSGDQPLAFSTLRHLDLNGHFTEVTTDLLPIFSRGSRLETLSTGSLKVPWSDFSQCDFSSLKKLETSGFPGASVGQILGTVPSLEVCNLTSFDFTVDTQPANTYSTDLRRLSIDLGSSSVGAWQSLRAPSLVHLSLRAAGGTEGIHIEEISLMLVRSGSVLQELTLYDIYTHEAINFINAHSSVTELTLSGHYNINADTKYPEDLFSRLTISKGEDEAILGPNLRSLTVQIQEYDADNDSARTLAQDIVGMVVSRADADSLPSGVSVLQKFSLHMWVESGDFFGHIRTSLEHLVASGLQLELVQLDFTYTHF